MYAPHHLPEPIEKIRKAKWSAENTAKTQKVVDDLLKQREHVKAMFGDHARILVDLEAAIARFGQLDAQVIVPLAITHYWNR